MGAKWMYGKLHAEVTLGVGGGDSLDHLAQNLHVSGHLLLKKLIL